LRAIENYVGPDLFRTGVTSYLKKYAFANAAGEDFWTEVTRVTGKPVDRIMKPFIEQPGVPVVKIESKCQGNTTDISLRQERFFGTIAPSTSSTASPLWAIPVCFKTDGGGGQQCELL